MTEALAIVVVSLAIESVALMAALRRADRRAADRDRVIRSQAAVLRAQRAAIEAQQQRLQAWADLGRQWTAVREQEARARFMAMPADHIADAPTWPVVQEQVN